MSQQLVPISGGVQILGTSTKRGGINVPSLQYIDVKGLQSRPTEWVTGGRPIYRRLPSVSETYQINFFDIVPASNTAVRFDGTIDIGYVYIPWGEGIFGPVSMEAVASETLEDLIIKSGQVVWKYGTTQVAPAILNMKELGFGSGRYLVAYQLVYDDAPLQNYYAVQDYLLTGTKLNITSSTDAVIGWRYPALNAFLDSAFYWSNKDSYFPTYAQPVECFFQWESNEFFIDPLMASPQVLPSAYSKIVVRCSPDSQYSGSATFSYVVNDEAQGVETVSILKDSDGQYFEINVSNPSFQSGWRLDFTDMGMKISEVKVTGVVTKVTRQAEPSTRCALSIYPAESVPTTVLNTQGEEVPATYCNLAYIDVDSNYELRDIQDIRQIIHREYKPIAEWLTRPFDEDLIDLYRQVKGYSTLWMGPVECMRQEYVTLENYGVELV